MFFSTFDNHHNAKTAKQPTKEKRVKLTLLCAATLGILFIGYIAFIALKINVHNAWQENMLSNGPWSGQSIWVSEGREIYLNSEKEADAQLAVCVAYISTDSGLIECTPELHYGSKTLDFCDEDGKILFTCKVDLIGEEKLKLYNIDSIAAILTDSKIKSGMVIYLIKSPKL